ncbi:MAG: hypothetical protein KDB23_08755, partial [Planctomycetales bacterium]|nr:hypothetical protein [Planctomycetales bacterium]
FERLRSEFGLAYALDETLRDDNHLAASANSVQQVDRLLAEFPHAAAWIVKPTLDGSNLDAFVNAVASTPPLVFSACFESGVGLSHLASLAADFAPNIPAGLDTYRWWGVDPCLTPPRFADGSLQAFTEPLAIDFNRLEELTP